MKICKDCEYRYKPWLYKLFGCTPDCHHLDAHRNKDIHINPVTGEQRIQNEYWANCVYERCFGRCGPNGKNFKQKDNLKWL